jgi:hypothetical protein
MMATLQDLCLWIYDLPVSMALRESDVVFPLIETFHVLAITLIVGTVITVDLRVGGLILRDQPLDQITGALLPYTWWGFAFMAVSGLPLFAAEAAKLYANPAFRIKLLLLALAGLNALLFHRTRARMFAGASILLWSGIIVSGRLIAVFHGH